MIILDDGAVVFSTSDLSRAAACEYAVLRKLDELLGRAERLELPADAMLERIARLGDEHEKRALDGYRARFGRWNRAAGIGVAEIERPPRVSRQWLVAKREETLETLRAGADVVTQAGFFDGRFTGWADFLVRDGSGAYTVQDAKLARRAKVEALLQLAAYADQLLKSGIPTAETVHLLLGDGTSTTHRLADLRPVYLARRARLEELLDRHLGSAEAVVWAAAGVRACLRCEACAPELEARRDVLLVAGLRATQRARLREAGITTIDEFAASEGPVEGIGRAGLDTLRAQAALQVAQEPPPPAAPRPVCFDLHTPQAVTELPAPDRGDIFFDFEGDPLWHDGAPEGQRGLEYLFGLVETPPTTGVEPTFLTFWAHDRAEEKQALLDFLDYVTERRVQYPSMHIYHYASYEKSALLRLAGRHGVGEEAVDQLLREGVLIDLYATVRASLRTGQRSYSIKDLEPLYLSRDRLGEVTSGGDSVAEYAEACAARDSGDVAAWQERLAGIADYNRLDCLSTLELRDWLLDQMTKAGYSLTGEAGAGSRDAGTADVDAAGGGGIRGTEGPATSAEAAALRHFAGDGPGRDADQQATALLAAALDYHWREDKPFWWAHFDRLASHPEEWTERRSTLLVDDVQLVRPWGVVGRARLPSRELRIHGRLEPGSELTAGAKAWALYDPPLPECATTSSTGLRGWTTNIEVLDVDHRPDGTDVLLVRDRLSRDAEPHDCLPMALTPRPGPSSATLVQAIESLAKGVADGLPDLLGQAAVDILRRRGPRSSGTRPLPLVEDSPVESITAAIEQLDHSYIAVQGPPGTGKTYVGARVIKALVEDGWRVGVVAQSHAVVENMLEGIVRAGLPTERVGKRLATGATGSRSWTVLPASGAATFYAQAGGVVVGGTAWTFTNPNHLPPEQLDLLVIDEAGQFSLANTLAVSTAARNLLLLGDPQQLPQVSQGTHPEPVDRSALGWLTDGHDTLPSELGYFLAATWRMHPALTTAVSRLSYEDRLVSMPCTAERSLEDVAPGVHTVLVSHEGNSVSSVEEAREVVTQVREVLGRRWRDPADGTDRQLGGEDVLVVAAYNAQVWTIRGELAAAGLSEVRVGTVDKFQGQQAPVVLVSLAASSADEVPRGMEFLLNRNRINVAVSRGQWCAVIIRSPALTDYLPSQPQRLEELGAFLGLSAQ